MNRITMVLFAVLQLYSITITSIPARCDESTDTQNIKTRMQLYFKWLRGTATQEERETAAQTIVQDSTIGVALAAIIGGGTIGSIRWLITRCKQRTSAYELMHQILDINTKESKDVPCRDIPSATIAMRVCNYDGKTKKNAIFLVSDQNAKWAALPMLQHSIELLCKEELFNKIQVHKKYRQNQDRLLYVVEKKNGAWYEKIYPD